MKHRRHHNNEGTRQIQRGKPEKQARRLADSLGVPYGRRSTVSTGEQGSSPQKPDTEHPAQGAMAQSGVPQGSTPAPVTPITRSPNDQ